MGKEVKFKLVDGEKCVVTEGIEIPSIWNGSVGINIGGTNEFMFDVDIKRG